MTTIILTSGDDSYSQADGDYDVDALAGNDAITLGNGNSTVNAGEGDDTVSVGWGDHVITLGNGANTLGYVVGSTAGVPSASGLYEHSTDAATHLTITGGSGDDQINHGGSYYVFDNATLQADLGDGNNTVNANATGLGTTVTAGSGNDLIYIRFGTNDLRLGDGNNTIVTDPSGYTGITANNYIETGAGNDAISTSNGNDTIYSGGGIDSISGGNGDKFVETASITGGTTITFTNGLHTITTGTGNDTITLGHGNSTVNAGEGDDTVSVGWGDHVITLGNGANTLGYVVGSTAGVPSASGLYEHSTDAATHLTITGGSGDDQINHGGSYYVFDNATLQADLGDGNNTVNANATGLGTTVTAGSGNDLIYIRFGTNDLRLGDGNNTIVVDTSGYTGITSNNYIETGAGNDAISLQGGNQTISAGLGDDTINMNGNLTLYYTGGLDIVYGSVTAMNLSISTSATLDFSAGYLVATIDAANVLTVVGVTDIAQVTLI